jgi:hypothetical protein
MNAFVLQALSCLSSRLELDAATDQEDSSMTVYSDIIDQPFRLEFSDAIPPIISEGRHLALREPMWRVLPRLSRSDPHYWLCRSGDSSRGLELRRESHERHFLAPASGVAIRGFFSEKIHESTSRENPLYGVVCPWTMDCHIAIHRNR